MSTMIESKRPVTPPPPDDPWYYGFRDVQVTLPDGKTKYKQIPLALEDTLHPQQGDHIVESDLHDQLRMYLASVFRWRTADDPSALILSDTGVYWDDPRLPYTHHCPDVAAIFGIKNRKPVYESFSVGEEGVRPRLIVELVSPNHRENDVEKKVRHYHEVEIPMYVIADHENLQDPWKLIGYRWEPDEYRPIQTRSDGRIWLDAVGIWLGADGSRLVCYERDGTEIGDYTMVANQLETEKQRAEAEKRRAEAEKQRAEAEKQRAEAEKQRAEAEKQRAEAAETKTKELEAEIARLRGQ